MKHLRSNNSRSAALLIGLSALWGGSALAGGDYDAGARKSFYCAYCHGYDGNPLDDKVPRLAGQKVEVIIARIKQIRSGGSMHQAMMEAIKTGNLSDTDILNLATFYARQPVRAPQWVKGDAAGTAPRANSKHKACPDGSASC